MPHWIDYRTARPLIQRPQSLQTRDESLTFDLTRSEAESLESSALQCPFNPYILREQEAFIAFAKESAAAVFASNTRTRIVTELDTGCGAVVLRGLPIDKNLPPTPNRGGALPPAYKETFVSEFCLVALGALFSGEIFNFHQEGWGSAPLIDNVVPVPELREQKGAGGYENNFPFHCESTWHRLRPDYVILTGVRPDTNALTLVFSALEIRDGTWPLPLFSNADAFRVRAPDLYVQMERKGIPMGTGEYSHVQPLRIEGGRPLLNINFNGTDCCDISAFSWLCSLEDLIEARAKGVLLDKGTAIILNNDRTCHTRTGYNPSFYGADRWFVRGNFKRNLWSYPTDKFQKLAALPHGILEGLVELGWMSDDGTLLSEFEQYIRSPGEVARLSKRDANLASIAFQFTPLQGVRIV